MTTVGVVQFPGTNCELDVERAVVQLGGTAERLWHGDATVRGVDAVVVPGGFAHGDYLRTGAIARFSPVMDAVADFAASGGPVVGICNGFQVLTEAGLLPGALQKNAGLKFICDTVELRVETTDSVLTNCCTPGAVLSIPINHFEDNYVCDAATLDRLRAEDRVVVRYVRNPNGSLDDIAGICNERRNVVGLMPHPERASDAMLGSADGVPMLESLLAAAAAGACAPAGQALTG
jgi:phosphoribosylformylglycinamidine synthase